MNSSTAKGLKVNPFTTVRDPQTGQWYVCRPDNSSDSDSLAAPKPNQSSKSDSIG